MTQYYQKEIPEMPVWVKGHPVKFDILETADPVLIGELDAAAAKGVGGVIKITAEQYAQELKKKANGSSSQGSSKPPQFRQELSALHASRVAEAAGRGSSFAMAENSSFSGGSSVSGRPMPDPIEVPSTKAFSGVFKKGPPTPPTGKASEIG